MSRGIDVRQATAAFEKLAPTLAADEQQVRAADERFSDSEVLDRALRHALTRLRYHLNRETFEYLRWKVQVARTQAETIRTAGLTRRARDGPPDGERSTIQSAPLLGRAIADPATAADDMRAAFHAHDWAASPLGPLMEWPRSLRTAVQLVLDSAFPHVVLWGPDLIQIYNDGYRELMAARHPQGLGQPAAECWPEVWHLSAPICARALGGETVALEDALFPMSSAGVLENRYFTLSCSPVIDDQDGVGGLVLTLFETTAQVKARGNELEREHLHALLEKERSRLAEIFRLAPAFLVVLRGPDLVIELVNDSYVRLVGQESLIGQSLLTALPELREQGYMARLEEVLKTGTPFVGREIPVRLRRGRNGEEEVRYLDFVYQPMLDERGAIGGVIAHGSDVTEQVEARHAAEHALAVAENANAVKAQFLSAVSHELRTPLNAIGGYAQLMEMGVRGPVTPEQRHDLAAIQQSQVHLMGLINSLLNFAKVQAGKLEYSVERVIIGATIGAVEAMVTPQILAKGLTFASVPSANAGSDLAVYADPEKLRQILVNLVGNAIKFTPEGGSITVFTEAREDEVNIVVTDTGIGIAAGQLGTVFEPFVQILTPRVSPSEGVGLGLAISRDLARGMGGELVASSEVGVGTAMTLTLARA
jgi:PAS domain S-box-containing protein